MIRELIAAPSVSSVDPRLDTSNVPVAARLAEWAESIGFKAELVPVTPDGRKVNVVARLGGGAGVVSGLVLAGHTDTVPWDEARWATDPFTATEKDGRIYGLGSADMKSFLALALEAASKFRAGDLAEPLTILGSADEECTMSGARHLVAAGKPLGRRVVVGEPTGLKPIRKHKGILMESIRVEGQSGHSSNPALGRSALEGMHRVISEVLAYRSELQTAHRDEAFDVPVPTLNLGRIEGGDAPNRICAKCSLAIDLRVLPGMAPDQQRRELEVRVRRVLDGSGLEVFFDTLAMSVEPFETASDADLVKALETLSGQLSGSVAFATEGPFYNALGMETVIWGPGSIDVAHQPNEFLPAESIEPTVELLSELITRYCVRPSR